MNHSEEDLAALLAEHQADWQDNLGFCCTCLHRLPSSGVDEALAAHVAAVIAAAGWVKGRKEWGVVYEGEREPDETSDDRDWLFDECITGVYDEGETPPKLVSRYVTDWEEA